MVSTRLVNHQKDTHLQQVYDFSPVSSRPGFGYFESGGDVQSNLSVDVQSRRILSADVQSRHYDELVHNATNATSNDVTPRGAGVCFG